jgi:hypothetical protein
VRRAVAAELNAEGGHALDETGWWTWNQAKLVFNVLPQLDLELGAQLSYEANDLRMVFQDGCVDRDSGRACTIRSRARTYHLAELDAGSLSFTLRGGWTFSPEISLDTYAQLFTSRGQFHDRSVVDTSGAQPRLRRADLRPDERPPGDDSFEDTSLHMNVVFRWEMAPGSTVIAVYQRAQDAPYRPRSGATEFRPTRLRGGPSEEVLLLKLVYFYS